MGAGARAVDRIGRGKLLAALLLLPVVALGLASCSETPKQSMPCPMVKPVPDASYLTRFAGESEDLPRPDGQAHAPHPAGGAGQVARFQYHAADRNLRLRKDRVERAPDHQADHLRRRRAGR